MIESVWAKNLLCFDQSEHRINCAPLTVIVGPNNSGKSAMIAAFNLLRDSGLRGAVQWANQSYNLGDFQSAVHRHEIDRIIEVGSRIRQGNVTVDFSSSIGQNSFSSLRYDTSLSSAPSLLRRAWYFRASRSDISKERQTGQGTPATMWEQPLDPYGSNIITYLLERWTDQDPNWSDAQEWLRKIDPELSILKSPLRGNMASLETTNRYSEVSINLAYQGTGIQKALAIIAAVIFSPPSTSIIIEEPEVHLERGSIETLVDLFNYAVANWKKQIIITTHSVDLLLQYASDVGFGTKRGGNHVVIDPSKFNLITFERSQGSIVIKDQDMKGRFTTVMERLKSILKPEITAKASIPA